VLKELDRVGASLYISEVRELIDALLHRIDKIERARQEWLIYNDVATSQTASRPAAFSYNLFSEALNRATAQHTVLFDEFEGLLAAWARLSLLFHPQWRQTRGKILRSLLDLTDDSLLANRSFRDSWMHFDERLDNAYQDGWLGNRQQFVRTIDVSVAIRHSVRVIDIEGLAFHYRDKELKQNHVTLAEMKTLLLSLQKHLETVGPKIMTLPAPA
jgi:hypothetical protein